MQFDLRTALAVTTFVVAAPTATIALAAEQTVPADAGALPVGRLTVGTHLGSQLRSAAHDISVARHRAERRARLRRERRAKARAAAALPPQLAAIAACESGGDPRAVGGGGAYRGKYQFSYATWAAVGGHGDPATAPEAEQDRRAAMLYAQDGPGQWPVCGR